MPSLGRLSILLALVASYGVVAAPTKSPSITAAASSSDGEHSKSRSAHKTTQNTQSSTTSQATPVITAGRNPAAQLKAFAAVVAANSSRSVSSQGFSPGPTALPTYVGYWTPIAGAPNPTNSPNLNILNSQFLGNVTPINSRMARDLGWHGSIDNFQINSYGDASQCKVGATLNNCWDGTNFVGSNSAAYSTTSPLFVQDFNFDAGGRPQQFCPTLRNAVESSNIYFAIGISNVVQTGPGVGIIYTAANNRTFSQSQNLGAGFGTVSTAAGYPVCTRTQTAMWGANEPLYGDTNAVNGGDGYIYAFGSYGQYEDGMLVYLARVPIAKAFTLAAYQYWDQSKGTWSSNRMYNPTPAQAVMQGVPSAQPFWSAYLKKWVMLARNPVNLWGIDLIIADKLSGPWSGRQTVYQETNWNPQQLSIYGPSPQPQYDTSGKTLTFTYAIWGNHLQAAKITFA